jgi:hypothetical protein
MTKISRTDKKIYFGNKNITIGKYYLKHISNLRTFGYFTASYIMKINVFLKCVIECVLPQRTEQLNKK